VGRRPAIKDFLKLCAVTLKSVELGCDLVRFRSHICSGPCRQRLFLKRLTATVPVILFMIPNVPERRAATRQLFAKSAHGFGQTISQTLFADVTRITGPRAIHTQAFVENNCRPSDTFSSVIGLSAGIGIAS